MTVIDATEAKGIMCEVSEGGIRKILPTDDGEELIQMIREQQFDLVIIDNASDGYEGDENSRRQVRSFIRYLANSVREHHGAVLLLAHVDKTAARFGSGKNTYSGSTGWHNSARSRLALVDGELFQEKLNVGKALGVPIPLGWTPQAVPVPSGSSGAASARLLREEADDLAIMACFRAASEAGQVVPSAATGPSTVWHVLSAYPELPTSLKRDKSRLKEGIARLRRSGKLRAETYRNHQRNLRERLLLADDSDSSVCVSDL
jgi:CheY-like chemotaxis protein